MYPADFYQRPCTYFNDITITTSRQYRFPDQRARRSIERPSRVLPPNTYTCPEKKKKNSLRKPGPLSRGALCNIVIRLTSDTNYRGNILKQTITVVIADLIFSNYYFGLRRIDIVHNPYTCRYKYKYIKVYVVHRVDCKKKQMRYCVCVPGQSPLLFYSTIIEYRMNRIVFFFNKHV